MNRRAVLLAVVGVVGVVALWWVFIFSPKADSLSKARENLSTARTQAQSLQAKLNQLKDLQRRSTQIEAQLGKLTAAIPKTPNQADFISGLNDIADQSGITWQSVTMSQPAASTPGSPDTITVQIQIQGGFFQALDYMNRLENLGRLVVVDGVNVAGTPSSTTGTTGGGSTGSGSGVTAGSGDLTVTMNSRIFSQNAIDAAAPGGATTSTTTPGQVVN
ncbi:MAG: Tfp pilus assembly protein PilO [Actinomycetia bacterium]|nr:Tfp pilus assembly protein PilO [Actinomycetes bacterium]